MNLTLYKDRDLLSKINDVHLLSEIKRRCLFEVGKSEKVSFCGVIAINGHINVFVPRGSNFDLNNKALNVRLASNTLKAVESYNNGKRSIENLDDDSDGAIGLSNLSLIKQLLDDYTLNGLYCRTKKIFVKNSTRPDWKQTIKNSILLPNKNNKFIYLDLISSKRNVSNSSIISLIHANVIKEIDANYSWILTGKVGQIAPSLKSINKLSIKTELKKYYLISELNQTYSEREIRLIKLLINFLDESSGVKENRFVAGVKKFHSVWEHMLRNVLDNKPEISKQLPITSYIDSNNKVLSALDKNMRTDIIIEDPALNTRAVVDAKYYESKSPYDAPGWGDMVKQFFYVKALESISSNHIIKNVFVFPGGDNYLKLAKMKNVVGNANLDLAFPPIKCIYVLPNEVLSNFVLGKKMHQLRSLIINS